MEELIRLAQESYNLGRRAARRGAYLLALARYSEALGILKGIRVMFQSGEIKITKSMEDTLATLIMGIEAGYNGLMTAFRNGKENPSDSLEGVAEEMLEELHEVG